MCKIEEKVKKYVHMQGLSVCDRTNNRGKAACIVRLKKRKHAGINYGIKKGWITAYCIYIRT